MPTGAGSPVTTPSSPVRREPMAEAWNPWQKVYFPEDKSTGQLQCWEVQDADSEIIAVCWREADADLILADHEAAARGERLDAAGATAKDRLGVISRLSDWHDDTQD